MKVVVFGATGGSGRELVRQGLAQGHTMTAFVRNPQALALAPYGAGLAMEQENLKIAKGDILDYESVEKAVQGQEAVLSALGTRVLRKNTILSDGTRNIIRAMEKLGVRRFICESSLGVGDSQGQLGFLYNCILIPFFLRNVFKDKEIQERTIQESRLDWVIVRPAALTDGPHTGVYRSGFSPSDRSIKGKISRADTADFMLKQLTNDTYLRKTPGLSY